jgi:hypothetical protein
MARCSEAPRNGTHLSKVRPNAIGWVLPLMLSLCASAWPAHVAAADDPSVTPYRPSVSTPAALSAPGWLEVEAGLERARGSGAARSDALSYTLKLAFTPDWGVRLGGDAFVRQTDESGQRLSGTGDTSVVLKRRFAVNDDQAFGIEAGATLPTGRDGIGSGKSDVMFNGIYSADLGAYHLDLNLGGTRFGQAQSGSSRVQALWAAGLSRSLSERWSVVGELSGTRQRGKPSTQQFLVAGGYSLSNRLALDAGLSRSLHSGTPDWSVFAGLTWLAARIF